MRRQVLVVSGGESSEHDVSVASGADVAASLRADGGFAVLEAHIDRAGLWHIGDSTAPAFGFGDVLDEVDPATVVFPVLHGGWGEGGGLQHELERRGIEFVGCGAESAARALSKAETMRTCAVAGVGIIPTRTIDRRRYLADPDLVAGALGRAVDASVVVKPDAGGSSIGVHIVPRGRGLRAALDDVFVRDSVALIQPVVDGQEVSVGVWQEPDGTVRTTGASLLRLPQGDGGGFSYAHKYEGAGAVLEIPAALPAAVLGDLRAAAERCFEAMGCRGLARIDFFVAEGGRILLNEINTIPGLRRESHFPRLVAAAGVDYDTLLARLVAGARRSLPAEPLAARR